MPEDGVEDFIGKCFEGREDSASAWKRSRRWAWNGVSKGAKRFKLKVGEEKEVSEISTDRVYADSYSYLIYSGLVVTSF